MNSPKMSIAMAMLVLGLLAASSPSVAVKTRRSSCSILCGRYFIPYPFGIGPECSMPGFNLTCAAGAGNTSSKLLLGNPSIELLQFDEPWVNLLSPTVTTNISYVVKLAPAEKYSVHWEAPGRPFAISGSSDMSLFVVGCAVKASLFIGDSGVEVGNCYAISNHVVDAGRTVRRHGMLSHRHYGDAEILHSQHLAHRSSSAGATTKDGNMQPKANCPTSCGNVNVSFPFGIEAGCFAKPQMYLVCNPKPSPVLQMLGGAVVTNISIDQGILRLLKPSDPRSQSLDDMYSSLYAISGAWGGGVDLKWVIDNLTCENAMASKDSYRCYSYSDCIDVTDNETQAQLGYRCKCSSGFGGNPYIKDGCTDINECMLPDEYNCNGICQNTFGNYLCTNCPRGTYFNDGTRKCNPSTVILGVTIGVSTGGGILFLVIAVAIFTRRWKSSVQKRLRKKYFLKNKGILLEQLVSSDHGDGTKIFSLDELEKATNNFDNARVVGHGGHGTVYKGILTNQRVVAIKRSKLVVEIEIEQFINEVSILSHVNHRNVVKLHGCCLEAEIPLLVYEFITNGTLYDLLHREQNGALLPVSWEERLRIAIEIAGALTYLHSAASVSILHRDVNSMNVLLNESYRAKVSDFGASRLIPIDQTHLVTAVQGTFGYLDLEYYHTSQLNEKSDVYSF